MMVLYKGLDEKYMFFEMMIKGSHKCPICSYFISPIDFIEANKSKNMKECRDLWMNDNIEIPCCTCYNILTSLRIYDSYEVRKTRMGDVIICFYDSYKTIERYFPLSNKYIEKLVEKELIKEVDR